MPDMVRSDPTRRHISIRWSRRSPLSPERLLTAILAVLAVAAVGCGSTTKTTTTTPASTTTATTSAPASTTATTSGLSGTWRGQYSGAYQGTFTLTWQQAGSNLSGIIGLSAPAVSLPIHGTVVAGAIQFGTVGSFAISYSGSVSGNSMSGTYRVNGSTGGSWSATKAP